MTALPDAIGPLHPFPRTELERRAPEAARGLLGALLVRHLGGTRVLARIVEVEAYREDDPASHSYRGRTQRTAPMFERPGTAYIYRSYGIHWCCNVTVEPPGVGAAVLLRAAAVLDGQAAVRHRRPDVTDTNLLRGPGNLAAGLDLDGPRHGGLDLIHGGTGIGVVTDGWRPPNAHIAAGPRVGVTEGADVAWRYWVVGAAEVSAYRRSPRAPADGGTADRR